MLADQRQEALKTQELVHGHLNAMALRLGELQARMMRLDGLGERLAKVAGLQPQEFPSLQPGKAPGRGGAESSLPSRSLSVDEFSELLASEPPGGRAHRPARRPRGAARRGLGQPQVHADAAPVVDGWFSSNFGYRIDPFTGMQSFHEGIDFPADSGTPVVAAASGKVVESGYQPQYGKSS